MVNLQSDASYVVYMTVKECWEEAKNRLPSLVPVGFLFGDGHVSVIEYNSLLKGCANQLLLNSFFPGGHESYIGEVCDLVFGDPLLFPNMEFLGENTDDKCLVWKQEETGLEMWLRVDLIRFENNANREHRVYLERLQSPQYTIIDGVEVFEK